MRITQMDLEDFGIYHNVTWQPPQSGLIVMHGQNESGKTTLMKYVRSMFFGYPRGEWQGFFGHMSVRRDDGQEYKIYRNEKDSYIVGDGETLHEEPSDLWWHGLDRQTYDKIFALGLEDLQGFKILSNDEVRNHFFSAQGGVQMGVTRRDIIRLMGEQLVASPQGKKPINVLLHEQKDFDQRINSLSYQEDEFADLQSKEMETHEEEKRVRMSIAELKLQMEQVSMPITAWDVYKRGQDALKQMENMAEVAQFPQDGAQRWSELESKIKEIDEQIKTLQRDVADKSAFLPEWNRWIYCGGQLEELFSNVPQWRSMEEELAQKLPQEKSRQAELDDVSGTLRAWTETGTIPAGVDWKGGLAIATDLELHEQEQAKWEAAKPKNVTADKVLEQSDTTKPQRSREEWEALDKAASSIQQDLNEQAKIVDQLAWLKEGPAEASKAFLWFGILLFLGAAGLLAGVILYGLDEMTGYIGAGICAVIALGAFVKYSAQSGKAPKKISELQQRSAMLQQRIGETASQAGIEQPGTANGHAWTTRLDDIRRQYMDWQTKENKGEWEKQQQVMYESLVRKWEAEGEQWKTELERSRKAWAQWQSVTGFVRLSPKDVNDAKQVWEQWRQQDREQTEWQGQKLTITAALSRFRDNAEQLFRELSITGAITADKVEDVYHQWQDIRIKAEVAKEQDRQQEQLQEQIEHWQKEKETRRHQQNELLKLTNSQSEGEFRSKIIKFRQFHQYKEIYEQSEAHIRLIAKNERNLAELRRALKNSDMDRWKKELKEYEDKIATYDKQLAAIAERRGSIVERLSQMAKNDTYEALLQEKQNHATTLDTKVDNWLTLMFTQSMLGEAQAYYERVRQPVVIRQAGEYLHLMTRGRYTLQASFDGRDLYAVDENQRRISEKQWSSGLGDQIFLAIRISLAVAFAQQMEPLPIILDDILVRFDEQRQEEALRFLADLGKKEQIFLFTCSAETQTIAQKVRESLDVRSNLSGKENTIHLYEISQGQISLA